MPEMYLIEGIWHTVSNHSTASSQGGYVSDDTDFRTSSPNIGLRVLPLDRFMADGVIKPDRDETVIMFYGSRKAKQLIPLCEAHRVAHHPEKNATFRVVKRNLPIDLVQMYQKKGYLFAWETG